MSQRQIIALFDGPPQVDPPPPSIHAALGEAGMIELLRDFYARLAVSEIAELFPRDPEALWTAADKSASFFTGLCGGPPLFAQRHGPPRMRMRHIPFPITLEARDEWLRCFVATLDEAPARHGFPVADIPAFVKFLEVFSLWMVNSSSPYLESLLKDGS
ncbi:MAG: hypothetical protein RL095_1018 [Verrucomicrobiota bacterium]|jgi:hemoglobin